MKIFSLVIVLLTRALVGEVSQALNVTVSPGPVVMCSEGENATLSCLVSQKRRASSVLVVRWLFSSELADERLIVKTTLRRAAFYGNYTRHFQRPKFGFAEEAADGVYTLLVLNVTGEDRGNYTCRVQEVRKHRSRWRSASNGTATAELRVHILAVTRNSEEIWRLFEDVYLCAVFLCSLGIVCMLLFAVAIWCQYLLRKRRLKENYYLVKCPDNSSGETVTSVLNSSPGSRRKEKKRKHPPREPYDPPPEIPAKVPVTDKLRRPKLLKAQPRTAVVVTISDDSLMYAELELVKPKPEPKASCTGTVYAQILFEEKQL